MTKLKWRKCQDCGQPSYGKRCWACYLKTRSKTDAEKHERNRQYQKQYYKKKKHPCPICGKLISRESKFCGKHRKRPQTGKDNPNWKGGRIKNRDGYILLHLRNHPRANARHQVFEHIVVWENTYGSTPQGWQIHHINGIRDDNRLENLIALPPKTHHHTSPVRQLLKKAQARIRELEFKLNHENKLL